MKLMPAIENVIRALKSDRAEQRIPVARLELNYELTTLSDALKSGDQEQIQQSKARLRELRRELLLLEA
ncbi:hypothetical protein [Brevibacillus laterosporus]|uniref:Uncharacterized protein n=2 Tax=Brevibacillus laterosporus TaxID=1465 RepID=A0A075RDH3_BRELA|nr:hypothetical protein [Brevibacillus laterosporus]AIG27460.1 hypothetical protein BRLA_c031480 [Brevibacillus laterosporus LMG 15441]